MLSSSRPIPELSTQDVQPLLALNVADGSLLRAGNADRDVAEEDAQPSHDGGDDEQHYSFPDVNMKTRMPVMSGATKVARTSAPSILYCHACTELTRVTSSECLLS